MIDQTDYQTRNRSLNTMLRITPRADDDGVTVLTLEGRLTSDLIVILEQALAAAKLPSRQLALDLNDLSYVDQAGAAALRQLLASGVGIARSSDWLRLLLGQPPSIG
ncbi:STAS domain-containing protein [Halochromatium glycolicum]|uniref:STAS domain-containing protein n=1 Tax=Halochromatium glycolicum TaxID=85075 RepID=A0AAJ0U2P0_9GAMM|nr:anti-sigma factor antagonist [Halochromatium glycolicum]MBK1704174.1 hypothetical protein [Halochromatium glycolicum]